MPTVRELAPDETTLAYDTVVELRDNVGSRQDFVERVNNMQRPEGYRLAASFNVGETKPVGVAGFRAGNNLAWGYFLYVDDLITQSASRKQGHATALMEWLVEEAKRLGCDQLHLDSGTQRHAAHRFYLSQSLAITSFHFARPICSAEAAAARP